MNQPGQRKLIEFISLILFSPVYLLVKLIPKNKNLHIYGSSLGLHFADNSKYLFLYSSKNIKKIKSVFISKNNEVVDQLVSNGYFAEYLYSFNGIKTVLRARKAFLNHSVRDIHPLLLGGAEIIQLWHGTPLKKIGYDADWRSDSTKRKIIYFVRKVIYFLFPYMYSSRWFDTIVASSEDIVRIYQTAFGITRNQIELIGQPRNDCFNRYFGLDRKIFREIDYLENLKKQYRIIVSWLPTHRGLSGKTLVALMDNYKFDNNKFADFLKKNNIGFIIKPHFLEKDALLDKAKICENLIVYDFVDPYPLLRYIDILITDYSSVFFDFLLTGKPIIFAPFDKEQYCQDEANFYYDYDEVTPGPKCQNWNDVAVELEKTMAFLKSPNNDPYFEKRTEVNNKFNYYKENFCRRVAERFIIAGKE